MAHKTREVAVMCWFPASKQEPIPISIKFHDDNGEITSIKNIHVKHTTSISQGKEFNCETIINGILHKFKLIFFSGDCRWLLVF